MILQTPKAMYGRVVGSLLLALPSCWCWAQSLSGNLNALSAYQTAGKNWHTASAVSVRLSKPSLFELEKGEGILIADPGKSTENGLISLSSYGDIRLTFDFMTTAGAKATIYLNGIYPYILADNWGQVKSSDQSNGAIPGRAPRQLINRAPGLWQHLTLSFRAPRLDASGKVTEQAILLNATLDGVLIHENVQWPVNNGREPTKATGPIRIDPTSGSIAFRNIQALPLASGGNQERLENDVDPILVQATSNTTLRSFMDIPSQRVVHCLSAGSAEQVHYSYDLDNGYLFQVWRGGFLDATPMWHDRGDGSSSVLGSAVFLGKPLPALAKLDNETSPWPQDSAGSGFFNKGYIIDDQDRPQFKYRLHGQLVSDAIKALPDGTGLSRTISLAHPTEGWYVLLAKSAVISEQSKGIYLINGQEYYIKLGAENTEKAVIRDAPGGKELLIPIQSTIQYSLIF
ncbi:protein of unknown function [bacterium A37T11]|nr:protein of unknown function [bacterium A37T11]